MGRGLTALAGASVILCVALVVYNASTPLPVSLKAKEDLSMFRDSSVSFFDPGDTAADADILPRAVLADDGSATDRASARAKPVKNDYTDPHWYEDGQSADVNGDLKAENERIDRGEKASHSEMQAAAERARVAHRARREAAEKENRAVKSEQRHERMEEAAEQRRDAEARARVRRHEREVREAHRASRAAREAHPPPAPLTLKQLHEELRSQNHEERLKQEGKDAGHARTSYAYRHPFAAGQKGMQHLVMAEFSQDEQRMKDTTDAIFGNSHERRHHEWLHGGYVLRAPKYTLHQAMQRRSAQLSAAQTRVQNRIAQSQARRGALSEQSAALRCSIEMLENGECSSEARVVREPAAAPRQPAAAGPRARREERRGEGGRGRERERARGGRDAESVVDRTGDGGDLREHLRGARAPRTSATAGGAGGYGAAAALRAANAGKGRKGAAVVPPSAAPTAGDVIGGWAKDLGSMF